MAPQYAHLSQFLRTALTIVYLAVAYFVPDTVDQLNTIQDHPMLASLPVPKGMYTSARNPKNIRLPQGYRPTRPRPPLAWTEGNGVGMHRGNEPVRKPF